MNTRQQIDSRYETYLKIPLVLIPVFLIMTGCILAIDVFPGVIAGACTLIYIVVIGMAYFRYRSTIDEAFFEFAMEHGKVQKELLKEFPIPYALLNKKGKFMWVNDDFSRITGTSKRKLLRSNIMQVFEGIELDMLPQGDTVNDLDIEYDDKEYRAEIKTVKINTNNESLEEIGDNRASQEGETRKQDTSDEYIAFYMFDMTEINAVKKENTEQKLVAGLIYIDNYDEIFDDLEEVRHSLLIALVDRKINKYMANVDAIV